MVCPSKPPLGSSPRRSIRLRHQRPTFRVRESGSRRKMPLLGRLLSPPASLWRVGPSPSGPDWSSPAADSPRPRARDGRGDTRLAFRVSANPPAPRLGSISPPPRRDSGPERPPTHQSQIRPDGLENFQTFWVREGIPDAVIEVIVAGRRSSTWDAYRSSWRTYTAYCTTRDLRPRNPASLASFLVASFHEEKSYATIRSYAFGVSVCLPRPDGLPSLATTRVPNWPQGVSPSAGSLPHFLGRWSCLAFLRRLSWTVPVRGERAYRPSCSFGHWLAPRFRSGAKVSF